MNFKILIYFVFIIFSQKVFSQDGQAYSDTLSAPELNDQALYTFQHYNSIQDSVRQSLSLLDEAIAKNPGFITARMNKISILSIMGLSNEMYYELEKARKVLTSDPELACIQGYLLDRTGREKEAMEKYQEADKMYQALIDANEKVMANRVGKTFNIFFLKGKSAGLSAYKRLARRYEDKYIVLMRNMFYNFDKESFLKNFTIPLRRSPKMIKPEDQQY